MMIYLQLVLSFAQVGLFSVGGGYAALPLIQQQVVDVNGWLTLSEFTHLVTIAEMTPGPIAINTATFAGMRIAGFLGSVLATFGVILPALFISSALAYIYYRYKEIDLLKSVLGSVRPAVVATIGGAGLSILRLVLFHTPEIDLSGIDWRRGLIFVIAVIYIRMRKAGPIKVMMVCGVLGILAGMI